MAKKNILFFLQKGLDPFQFVCKRGQIKKLQVLEFQVFEQGASLGSVHHSMPMTGQQSFVQRCVFRNCPMKPRSNCAPLPRLLLLLRQSSTKMATGDACYYRMIAIYVSEVIHSSIEAIQHPYYFVKLKMTKTVQIINKCCRGVHLTYFMKLK